MSSRSPAQQIARMQRRNRFTAGFYWLMAVAGAVFLGATILAGKLNPINLLVLLFVIIGMGASGLLSLSGDMVLNPNAVDEGQREAARSAQATAFYVGYFGVIGLWMAYLFVPAWEAGVSVHLGVLSLLIAVVWLGSWVWRRWHG
jgi:hypothetical protein